MEKTDLETLANSFVLSQNDIKLKSIFVDKNVYQGEEIKNKQLILKYLKSFKPSWFTSAKVIDNISKKALSAVDNLYDDGIFEWSESEIYHFEKYNMPLNDNFISHCGKILKAIGDNK